ncbi:MAG: phosphonate metabolism protein/1,5-bisphosphokinase (PRPP-forming) PhnN [Bradyrhizobium sp.]|uniref:phosphonate metabolism protein/1,5-bisphosphokinase (PRPP-forming) PhnN n=1 Tax=Bradyrhizobium sp. TaxID=376 RepID=UPI002718A785|nr:phosphonate metabolism protein/1,5-bisphosphokinase (PRPP-forming) PhnN [Bradyrhizobium sp.]MDO8398079.1 phosphonate metabolism protein/1,5-bisphosphokinase (PRPP-forming) PhnN [Bradyrhizobium sp.]
MTDESTISGHRAAAGIGPGRLVLVVGPSGAGKDTLIGLARAACADDGTIVFPRRVVTREPSSFEDNEQVSLEAFAQAQAQGEFAVHWEAHSHCYALRRAIDDQIGAGRAVVANVSRTVVEAMRRTYLDVVVVSITAPPEVLGQRLAARARRSDGQIADRLRRAVDDAAAAPDVTIMNVENAEDHALELLRAIRGA